MRLGGRGADALISFAWFSGRHARSTFCVSDYCATLLSPLCWVYVFFFHVLSVVALCHEVKSKKTPFYHASHPTPGTLLLCTSPHHVQEHTDQRPQFQMIHPITPTQATPKAISTTSRAPRRCPPSSSAWGGRGATCCTIKYRSAMRRGGSAGPAVEECSESFPHSQRGITPSENPAQDAERYARATTRTPGSLGAKRTKTTEVSQTQR